MWQFGVVIPAFNEAERIGSVLDTLRKSRQNSSGEWLREVLVVDDGSTDGTSGMALAHPLAGQGRLRVLRHPANQGKGAALLTGARACSAPYLILLDADLTGLTPDHLLALACPVAEGRAEMSVGIFRSGRLAPTLSHRLFPDISGQRAIRRELLLRTPGLGALGYGVEVALTRRAKAEGIRIAYVQLSGVSHAMKEEKFGLWGGAVRRLQMYRQMFRPLLQPDPPAAVLSRTTDYVHDD